MGFKKYGSIENSYKSKAVSIAEVSLERGLDTLCQVTEKVHGANFSFHVKDGVVRVARRNGFCDGGFFDSYEVIKRYKGAVLSMAAVAECQEVIIYGELAGDGIQREVAYGEKDFYVFDIEVCGNLLPTATVKYLCDEFGLTHTPVLFDNISLREALELDVEFKSLILETDKDNFTEGIVIKPCVPRFASSGSRIVFKKKSKAFGEVKAHREPRVVADISQADNELIDSAASYVTTARLSNVLSKEGVPTTKEFPKIAGLLLKDVLQDFAEDFGQDLEDMTLEVKRVKRELLRLCMDCVRGEGGERWVNICDGNGVSLEVVDG